MDLGRRNHNCFRENILLPDFVRRRKHTVDWDAEDWSPELKKKKNWIDLLIYLQSYKISPLMTLIYLCFHTKFE